jgi:hypothetical protein
MALRAPGALARHHLASGGNAGGSLPQAISVVTTMQDIVKQFHASKPDPHPDGDRWHTYRARQAGVAAGDSHLAGRT